MQDWLPYILSQKKMLLIINRFSDKWMHRCPQAKFPAPAEQARDERHASAHFSPIWGECAGSGLLQRSREVFP